MHCNSKRFWMFSFKDFRIRGFLLTSPFQDQPDSKRPDPLAVSATVGERELESSFSLLLKTHSNNLTRQKLLALDVKFWIFWHFSALELTRFLQFIEVSKLIKTGPRLTGSPTPQYTSQNQKGWGPWLTVKLWRTLCLALSYVKHWRRKIFLFLCFHLQPLIHIYMQRMFFWKTTDPKFIR